MDFYSILEETDRGYSCNPYAAKQGGEWLEGGISIDFLNAHYGEYANIDDMLENSLTKGHELYFQYLKDEGILN